MEPQPHAARFEIVAGYVLKFGVRRLDATLVLLCDLDLGYQKRRQAAALQNDD